MNELHDKPLASLGDHASLFQCIQNWRQAVAHLTVWLNDDRAYLCPSEAGDCYPARGGYIFPSLWLSFSLELEVLCDMCRQLSSLSELWTQ